MCVRGGGGGGGILRTGMLKIEEVSMINIAVFVGFLFCFVFCRLFSFSSSFFFF